MKSLMRVVQVFRLGGRDSQAPKELICIRNESCFGSEVTPDKLQVEIFKMLNILKEYTVQEIFFLL